MALVSPASETASIPAPPAKVRAAADAPPALICRNLWKIYGANADAFLRANPIPTPAEVRAAGLFAAVRDATLEIRQGEIFIIMGLSGSGKSTLVRCLSRLVEPTAGSVFYEHQNLLRMTPAELIQVRRHKMGMVFQNFALLPHRTVLGNVAFPLEVQGMGKAEREARALQMIELVGLAERAGYYPRELSGGQQQRVGIARSLAVEPALWFLDEPFSALDPLIRHEMQNEFLRLQRMLSKTIVFITHDFDEAIRLGDRIAIMKDGAIIQVGTAEELVLNPASDYVSAFTRHVARGKVLTAGGVCVPVRPGETLAAAVPATALVAEVAEAVLASEAPAAVVDADGMIIGKLERATVIANLVGGVQ
ncbi:betaine/proline/choline family ABC transporter ATP-binding protein [Ancylobacter sp. Lp-2]|uniref:quaternary amine ABC transporter ATP-binding protein n=1 Tax=Ancylobacter sp. Lp-2 TaxID=2881339 RepID=UPI001E3C7863|nr:betaine/proline/choline family ABC transporter ATP-binding protein [Ancylobacter sp. Lp-2]MCB4771359.1 betaine/proline/choline family ABC transporter ATP-binding protein [Ancylobacter sp. Lp-2]